MLDRLEFADHVSELPSYLRVVEREIESALCRTLRARGASEARDGRRISESLGLKRLPDDGSAAKLNIAEWGYRKARCGRCAHAGIVEGHDRNAGRIPHEDHEVGGRGDSLYERRVPGNPPIVE